MDDVFHTLKFFKRTNSLPGSLTNPAYDFQLPPSLQETLSTPRKTFGIYQSAFTLDVNEKKAIEVDPSRGDEVEKNVVVSGTPSMKFSFASPPHSIDSEYCGEAKVSLAPHVNSDGLGCPQEGDTCTSPLSTVEKSQVPKVVPPRHQNVHAVPTKVSSDDNSKPTHENDDHIGVSLQSTTPKESWRTSAISPPFEQDLVNSSVDMQKGMEKTLNSLTQQPQAIEEATDQNPLSTLTSTELCIAYDPDQMVEWMVECRDCSSHCPAGILEFIKKYNLTGANTATANLTGLSRLQTKATAGAYPISGIAMATPIGTDTLFGAKRQGKLDSRAGNVGTIGSSTTLSASLSSSLDYPSKGGHNRRSSTPFDKEGILSGQVALQAMESIWKDRKETPIAVSAPLRQRGIFGPAAKKEIHHMVLSVLNKVTTDAEKFQEVKKELLRLPIPEANAEQLNTIVKVFFKKAVREPNFSKAYAELMSALCTVPQGQQITGDKTQSIEYRMRRALLPQCQNMFLSGAEVNKHDNTVSAEEELTEKRRAMTGNVRFVSELFLCGIIPQKIIAFIFLTCCTGSADGTFTMPPNHMPTEVEVDEVNAATNAVGASFFVETKMGRELLPQLLRTMQYWSEHHTISRCRYILMDGVNMLSQWMDPSGVDLPLESTPLISQVLPLAASTSPSPTSMTRQQSLERQTVGSPASGGGRGVESANLSPKDNPSIKPCEHSISGTNTDQSSCSASGAFPNTPLSAPCRVIHESTTKAPMVLSRPIPAPRSSQNKAGLSIHSLPTAEDYPLQPSRNQPKQQRPKTAAPHPAAVSSSTQAQPRPIPKAEAIAKDMAQLKSGVVQMSDMLDAWIATYDDMLPILSIWTDRCLSVVREEANRLSTGKLLSLVLKRSKPAYQRSKLRELIFDGLERALNAQLHEDLKLFKFWAQTVLSDTMRVVLDEELLEGGLEYLFECRPSAVRSYLVDVGQWYSYVQSGENHLIASVESSGFLRYRPLLCQGIYYGFKGSPTAERPRMEEFADVRCSNLEFDVYYTLTHGSLPNIESLFEKLRTSPRLRNNYTSAAEVLSAVILAGMSSPENCDYLNSCIPLLQIVVDGPNRGERELALITEVHEVCDACQQRTSLQPPFAKSHILEKLRSSQVVSDESLARVHRFFVGRYKNNAELSDADSANVTYPLKQIEAAAEVQERPVVVNMPHHTWLSSTISGSSSAPHKASSASSGGPPNDRHLHPLHRGQSTEEEGGRRTTDNRTVHRGGGAMEAMALSMPHPAPSHLMPPGPNFNNPTWMPCMGVNPHQVQKYYRGAGRHNNDGGGYRTRNYPRGRGGYDEDRGNDIGAPGGPNIRHERRAGGKGRQKPWELRGAGRNNPPPAS